MADVDKRKISMGGKRKSGRSLGKGKGRDGRSDDELERENPFVFKIINESQTKLLLEQDVDEIQRQLEEILNLKDHEIDLLQALELDYFVGSLWWAKEQGFSVAQASAFFTAAQTLLLNIKEKHMHILDNLNEMRQMMSGAGVPEFEVPGGLDCFDIAQIKLIANYFHQTLFQHYKLYQFVYSHTQAEEVIGLDLTCELVKPADVPYPPPLDESLPYDVWEKYVKTPPPSPPPESPSEVEQRQAQEAERLKQEQHAEQMEEYAKENELLSKLTSEEIAQVVQIVTKETFKNLSAEMAAKLRERENTALTRINKIHKSSN